MKKSISLIAMTLLAVSTISCSKNMQASNFKTKVNGNPGNSNGILPGQQPEVLPTTTTTSTATTPAENNNSEAVLEIFYAEWSRWSNILGHYIDRNDVVKYTFTFEYLSDSVHDLSETNTVIIGGINNGITTVDDFFTDAESILNNSSCVVSTLKFDNALSVITHFEYSCNNGSTEGFVIKNVKITGENNETPIAPAAPVLTNSGPR